MDVDALLRAVDIEPRDLDVAGWRGDAGAMARLVRAIWNGLRDEYMGFTAQPMPLGGFAFACELALAGPSVGAGLARAIRFYTLANSGIITTLSEQDGGVTVTTWFAEPERDPDQYFSEFWLMSWHRLACWLAGETVPMLAARFDTPRPAGYIEEFKYLFPCDPLFGAADRAIVMDAAALAGPVRRGQDELEEMLRTAPLAIMTIPASDTSLSRRVRVILRATMDCDAAGVATMVDMDADRLRRALRREGTSLTGIREKVRRDRATRDLARTGLSVEAIAAALGYAEARSFTRAFRAWTGMSPSDYRNRCTTSGATHGPGAGQGAGVIPPDRSRA
jgi:AraC-like DNA-binding protein